ncbi:hypothetical protein IKF02_01125 [Candidatus Saccharibacteria bacterium]|nr:hypothetical protein [Candidatus Saccharibacteria bacterium]
MSESIGNKIQENDQSNTSWDSLQNIPFSGDVPPDSPPTEGEVLSSNAGEPWEGFPDSTEGVDTAPDVDGAPQTTWRGERYYLDNIDELGKRPLSTKGHEATHNRDGKVYMARDKYYAATYAVGTDGAKFYDEPLPVEQIPIGVILKINNNDNHLHAERTSEEPDTFSGQFREFITDEVPVEDYEVDEIYIMDDFVADDAPYRGGGNYKNSGHVRADFRRPMEVYKIKDQSKLEETIEKVKKRMLELDATRRV